MRIRLGLATLAASALALGLLAPASVSAAPEAAKPTGEANVRIDGGAARAIERGDGLYRIVLPRESSIRWLGEANRKPTIGTLGRKGLVAGWSRLGHRKSGTHALATVTYGAAFDQRPTYVGAYVGNPRVNSDGLLTFLARTAEPLPARLANFSLNIARPVQKPAGPSTRSGYPLVFPLNAASATVGTQATATGDSTATVAFVNISGGAITATCDKPTSKNLSSTSDYITFAGTCGDTTWSYGTLSLGLGVYAQIQMYANMVVKGATPSTFTWNFNMGQWGSGGVQQWP